MVALGAEVGNGAAPQTELYAELDGQAQIMVRDRLEGSRVGPHIVLPTVFFGKSHGAYSFLAENLTPFQHLIAVIFFDAEGFAFELGPEENFFYPGDGSGVLAVQNLLKFGRVHGSIADGLDEFFALIEAGEEATVGRFVYPAEAEFYFG